MEDYYEYLDSNGVTTLYKLIKDDTVALIDSYSVTVNGITTTLDIHINDSDIHTPISDIENMVDTKISGLVNSAPETLDTLKELSDALGNDPNFATTVATQIGNKASKDSVYTKEETNTLLEDKANSVHSHVTSDITDFPTIPTKTSQLINDSGYITSISWSDITNKPNFSTVATSGSYTDLSNTPTIPTKVSQLENDMGFGTGGGSGDTSDCVHKTGDESIDGIKTFTSMLKIAQGTLQVGSDAGYSVIYSWNGNIVSKQPSGTFNIALPNANGTLALDENLVHKSGNEIISGDKAFSNTIFRTADITTSTVETVYKFTDSNASPCGSIYNRMHWYNNNIYNRHQAYNATSGKDMFFEVLSANDGSGVVNTGGSVTNNKNLTTVTSETGSSYVATMGWVNNPATSTNVVHRSGDETIAGNKTFSNRVSFPSGYYITTDTNDNSLRIIRNGTGHGNNYKVIIQGDTGKFFSPNGFMGNLQGNADTSTSSTYATTQATTDNSTKIATTAWVRTYVNSVAGSNTVGSSVSAYWSNSSNVTATGQASAHSSSSSVYPACYSDYVNKTPTVGTIYSGAQLYTAYGTSANATGTLQSQDQYSTRITTTTAQVTFRSPISATGKYLCTTANTVKFRAYTTQGSTSTVGASSIVDYTITKSIFIRVE